jgi:hypothetical protein
MPHFAALCFLRSSVWRYVSTSAAYGLLLSGTFSIIQYYNARACRQVILKVPKIKKVYYFTYNYFTEIFSVFAFLVARIPVFLQTA